MLVILNKTFHYFKEDDNNGNNKHYINHNKYNSITHSNILHRHKRTLKKQQRIMVTNTNPNNTNNNKHNNTNHLKRIIK